MRQEVQMKIALTMIAVAITLQSLSATVKATIMIAAKAPKRNECASDFPARRFSLSAKRLIAIMNIIHKIVLIRNCIS